MTIWHHTPLQHAMRRDNRLVNIAMMLDHGGDPSLQKPWAPIGHRNRRTPRPRRCTAPTGGTRHRMAMEGVDRLIAACACRETATAIRALTARETSELLANCWPTVDSCWLNSPATETPKASGACWTWESTWTHCSTRAMATGIWLPTAPPCILLHGACGRRR